MLAPLPRRVFLVCVFRMEPDAQADTLPESPLAKEQNMECSDSEPELPADVDEMTCKMFKVISMFETRN